MLILHKQWACRPIKPSSRIEVPALVIRGENDAAILPQTFRGIEKVVTNVQLHILPDCSHWVQQDRCALGPPYCAKTQPCSANSNAYTATCIFMTAKIRSVIISYWSQIYHVLSLAGPRM